MLAEGFVVTITDYPGLGTPGIHPYIKTKHPQTIRTEGVVIKPWHRAILTRGNPLTIFAAAAFHNRVRDGSVWVHNAIDTRKT